MSLFMTRTASAHLSHRRRADKARQQLTYNLAELRAMITETLLNRICTYCHREQLTQENWSCDHRTPLSRGGASTLGNLVVCCRKCNTAKANLLEEEYRELRKCMRLWSPTARESVLRRLRASAKIAGGVTPC